jgi:hypothetical protein
MASQRLVAPKDEREAKQWTDIFLKRPCLATFTSRHQRRGYGHKRGPTERRFFNWQRTFFLLQYPFLSYFGDNDQASPCLGVVYLRGASVTPLPSYPGEKHVIKIEPVVRRNLTHVSRTDDENNYYIRFDAPKDYNDWLLQLGGSIGGQSTVTGNAAPPDGAADGGTALDPAAAVDAFGSALAAVPAVAEASVCFNDLMADAEPSGRARSGTVVPDAAAADDPKTAATNAAAAATSTQQSRTGGSSASAAASAALAAADMKRRSFFTFTEVTAVRNTDFVHHVACARCEANPIYGFKYSCVACDSAEDVRAADKRLASVGVGTSSGMPVSPSRAAGRRGRSGSGARGGPTSAAPCVELCASCFHAVDHDPSHVFVVDPPIDGETMRVHTPLEGAGKPFRTVELVAFEALFRVIAGAAEDAPTRPISKRRLLLFWDCAREVADVPTLSERDLASSRAPAAVSFDEFMTLLRVQLMHGERTFDRVSKLFDTVVAMVRAEAGSADHGGGGGGGVGAGPSTSPSHQRTGSDGSVTGRGELSRIEAACLRVYIGAATSDGEYIPLDAAVGLLDSLQCLSAALPPQGGSGGARSSLSPPGPEGSVDDDAGSVSCQSVGFDRGLSSQSLRQPSSASSPVTAQTFGLTTDYLTGAVPITEVVRKFKSMAVTCRPAPDTTHATHHGVIEAIETALLFTLEQGLGMYSAQPETFHPRHCDRCNVTPIIGFRFACDECDDFDLCARCFFRNRHEHLGTHAFTRYPGGLSVGTMESVSGGDATSVRSKRRARGVSGARVIVRDRQAQQQSHGLGSVPPTPPRSATPSVVDL